MKVSITHPFAEYRAMSLSALHGFDCNLKNKTLAKLNRAKSNSVLEQKYFREREEKH